MKRGEGLDNNIQKIRKAKGVSQEELAMQIGVHTSTLSQWENGHFSPKVSSIQKICEVLNVSEAELLNGAETERWTLEVRAGGKEVVNMNNSFGCVSSVSCGADGATLTLGGKYETFMNDEKFEGLIDQLWAARELVVETGEKMKTINKAKKGD